MPLEIIRNDITKVSTDAIVNTANPHVAIGPGTDQAIYEAAGADKLLAARAKIGELKPGQAAYTPAFGLRAGHIIHTVGPAWRGGHFHERETAALCYRNSLRIADELGCESTAFPLISSGTYGFPKDEALKIAISEISSFLMGHDMTVYLVVYDRESFVISSKAFSGVRSYIEEHDVMPPVSRRERSQRRATGAFPSAEFYEESYRLEKSVLMDQSAEKAVPESSAGGFADYEKGFIGAPALEGKKKRFRALSLEQILKRRGETFQQKLLRTIDRKGMSDPEVYKRSNIDRKLFSKIRSDVNYNPSKRTVMALIIGLQLNLDEATDLLQKAGYSFSPSSVSDLTVRYCIEQQIYDIHEINCYLFTFGEKTLGA